MGDQLATIMEEHYSTFITEEDFMLMADAGLNWIRLPIGFWALETLDGEPFLEGVSWKYIVQALGWARKYGLRVKLDLHASPGSANGWNHSGRIGSLNFLRGVMGLANAQRTLDYIRRLAEFINQPEWKDVVPVLWVAIWNPSPLMLIQFHLLAVFSTNPERILLRSRTSVACKCSVYSSYLAISDLHLPATSKLMR